MSDLFERDKQHYFATGKMVKCECVVYNLPIEQVIRLYKRGHRLFKGKRFLKIDSNRTAVYPAR